MSMSPPKVPSRSEISTLSKDFIASIVGRTARIAVIGLGYVGLPLALGFHARGFQILGIDVDPAKVDALKSGKSYIQHIAAPRIAEMVRGGRFEASTDFAKLGAVDAIIICVPTPLTRHLEPDMSYIVSTCEAIAPHLGTGQLVVLESTTYPGTTRDVMVPILEKGSGIKSGRDFFAAFSPEREDPGNPAFETTTIAKIVGALGAEALEVTCALYSTLVPKVVPVSSPEVAEAAKLTENIFRSVNIAMVNEMKLIYDAMGIDVWQVIDAASSKPFGFMPFYPGPGLGGHCIPIDPFYLTWRAREFGMRTRFIELSGEINRAMPRHVVGRLRDALSERHQKALHGSRILLIGVAYKKNVDDMRESPSLALIELLESAGASVAYYDPHIPVIPPTREHAALAGRKSIVWDAQAIKAFDAVLIATDHDAIDWDALVEHARLVVDTRNASARAGLFSEKIVKA
jgi:UDP-N-acetyl-D-glucosamine dehydrogenase